MTMGSVFSRVPRYRRQSAGNTHDQQLLWFNKQKLDVKEDNNVYNHDQ